MLKSQNGFTFIELMVTIAIVGILLAVAAPNMSSYWRKSRLVSATEAIYSQMQLARSVALAKNEDIDVRFTATGASWRMGVTEHSSGPCPSSGCSLSNMPGTNLVFTDYPNTSIAVTNAVSTFTMPRGVVDGGGNVVITLDSGEQTVVRLSVIGRVSICSDDLNQYGACP